MIEVNFFLDEPINEDIKKYKILGKLLLVKEMIIELVVC